MKNLFKGLMMAALVVSVALLLPWVMEGVMADTLNTAHPFDVAAQPAQEDDAAVSAVQEEDAPQATVVPAPTALPMATKEVQAAAVPTPIAQPTDAPATLQPALDRVYPTPIPAPGAADLQPASWRALLTKGDTQELQQKLQAVESSPLMNGLRQTNLQRYSVLQVPGGRLVAENLLPLSLADQKLLAGVVDNLNSPSIYVPEGGLLDDLMSLNLEALTVDPEGRLATMLATNTLRVPLRVLRYASMNGQRTLTPQEYLGLRDTLHQEMRQDMRDEEAALQKSLDLVAQLLYDDQPWDLAVIGAEPYEWEPDWEYCAWGHHIKTIDRKTGQTYTITTDLGYSFTPHGPAEGRVIGFSEDDAQPYLSTYADLVQAARGMYSVYMDGEEIGSGRSLKTLEQLTGIPFGQQPAQWHTDITLGGAVAMDNTVLSAQEVSAAPADAETRMVDKQGPLFLTYALQLDDQQQILAYEASYAPSMGSSSMMIKYPLADDEDWQLKYSLWVEDYQDPDEQVLRTLQYVQKESHALAMDTLNQQVFKNAGFLLMNIDSVSINRVMHSLNDSAVTFISTQARVQATTGKRYLMVLHTDLEQNTTLGALWREELPIYHAEELLRETRAE